MDRQGRLCPRVTPTESLITNDQSISVGATFSMDISGFEAGDINASNGTVTNLTGSGTDYSFDIEGMLDGIIPIHIPSDRVQDVMVQEI